MPSLPKLSLKLVIILTMMLLIPPAIKASTRETESVLILQHGRVSNSVVTIKGKENSLIVIAQRTSRGDVNQDDTINALDITKLVRVIAKLDTSINADVNLDNKTNALDITALERIMANS